MWKISPNTETLINLHHTLKRENSEVDFVYSNLFIGNKLKKSSSTADLGLTGRY